MHIAIVRKRFSRNAPQTGIMKKKAKLDGVGPVDNRPSTNKHHNFVQKKSIVTCGT